MFCSNCGKEVDDKSSFCSSCGWEINTETTHQDSESKKLSAYSTWLMYLTFPLNIIIRMLCQKEGVRNTWREITYHYVPSNMKVVMFLITGIMIIAAFWLNNQSNYEKKEKKGVFISCGIIFFLINAFIIMKEW